MSLVIDFVVHITCGKVHTRQKQGGTDQEGAPVLDGSPAQEQCASLCSAAWLP